MPIKEEIKVALAKEDKTLTDVINVMNEGREKKDTLSNVSKKIRTATLRYADAEEIADVLGYEIVWKKKDKPND